MTKYVEYEIENGETILIVSSSLSSEGLIEVGARNTLVEKSKVKFSEAFDAVKLQAQVLKEEISELEADEVKVKFGLVTTGELGNFAIGKAGLEANYEITLKWKNKTTKK